MCFDFGQFTEFRLFVSVAGLRSVSMEHSLEEAYESIGLLEVGAVFREFRQYIN